MKRMMTLRKLSETNTTITLIWDAVTGGVLYRGTRKSYLKSDGSQRWTQTEGTQMKFQKDEWYRVEALQHLDSGTYPPSTPTAVFPSTTRYPSEVLSAV